MIRKGTRKLIVQEIFRVLYSPLKAFEKLAKTPDFKGPLLIFLITLLASASAQYISSSKTLLETEKESGVYIPLTATDLFSDRLIFTLRDAMFIFFLRWLIYGVTFLLILKLFRAKEGPWHQLFIMIGYTFIVATIFIFVDAIIISTFPAINLDFDVWNGVLEGNEEMLNEMILEYERTWGPLLAYQLRSYFPIIIVIWAAVLGAVAIHFLREVSWNKALIVSAIVSAISLFLMGPLAF